MRPPSERQIQIECVSWFRMRYPEASKVFFAVPNGGAGMRGRRRTCATRVLCQVWQTSSCWCRRRATHRSA